MKRSRRSFTCLSVLCASLAAACSEPAADELPRGELDRSNPVEYRLDRRFPHLGAGTIIKTPAGDRVDFAGRASISLSLAQTAEANAHRADYGALDSAFAQALRRAPSTEVIRVGIVFGLRQIRATPGTMDSAVGRAEHRGQIASAVSNAYVSVAEQLRATGITEVRRARLVPIVVAEGTPDAIEAAARVSGVTRVFDGRPGEARELGYDPVSFHNIDTIYNDANRYATGQRVGIMEAGQFQDGACGLYDGHEALSFNSVHYQDLTLRECVTDANCGSLCDTCIDGACVTGHGSQVASVIAKSESGTPRGSAQAEIYFPNAQPVCDILATVDAFEYLLLNDVYTVNQSYTCDPAAGDGTVHDRFTRVEQMTVIRNAGNEAPEGVACEYLVNAICVGATEQNRELTCYTNTLNPPGSDREEPDVTAFGGLANPTCDGCSAAHGVEVMSLQAPDMWTSNCGTSFAAPSVASLVLLMREACEERFGFMSPLLLRAIFRNASWHANPDSQLRYSTPSPSGDWGDGGGFILANSGMDYCQPGSGVVITDGGDKDLDLQSGQPLPDDPYDYIPEEPRGEGYEPYDYAPPGTSGRRHVVGWAGHLKVGQRLRYTISWNSCATAVGTGPTSTAVDIDLFLRNATTQRYVYGSQSVDDVNEGFDVVIQEADAEGDYEILIAWPDEAVGCDDATVEPYGWASAVWP